MIANKLFLKKIISYLPVFLSQYIRKLYYRYSDVTYFIPFEKNQKPLEIINRKFYRLDHKNFEKFKNNFEFFLIIKKKSIKNYSSKRLEEIINLFHKSQVDVVYDGDDPLNTEIVSKKLLEFYSQNFSIENYPYRFFYIKDKFKVKNIGSMHRSYNFNGTFNLPSGGRSIGDGGPVENRLRFIPDLTGKTFLDVGSEEGYAVFEAIKKNAKFAKGLNINEASEYDFYPEYSRPKDITSRLREEINKTQKFLLKEFDLENSNKIQFEYNNIYNLSDEKFDFVFCFGVLYHLKNPYLAIENLFKITKETLVIETQGIKNEKYLNAGISIEDGFIRHSSNALAFLLKKAGFKKVEILKDAYDKKTLMKPYNNVYNVQNIVLRAYK
ncbi:MAG: DUF1698 domain-containing protein [Candidatus Pelagibacter sp.]